MNRSKAYELAIILGGIEKSGHYVKWRLSRKPNNPFAGILKRIRGTALDLCGAPDDMEATRQFLFNIGATMAENCTDYGGFDSWLYLPLERVLQKLASWKQAEFIAQIRNEGKTLPREILKQQATERAFEWALVVIDSLPINEVAPSFRKVREDYDLGVSDGIAYGIKIPRLSAEMHERNHI